MTVATDNATDVNQSFQESIFHPAFIGVVSVVLLVLVGLVFGRFNLLPQKAQAVAPTDVLLSAETIRFTQDTIHVKSGEPVTLQLANADFVAHSFDIDALDLHVAMEPNDNTTARFIAPEPGTYTFTCNIPGHTEAGMVGTLIVEN